MIAPTLHYSVYNLQFDDSSYITLQCLQFTVCTLHYSVYNLQFADSRIISISLSIFINIIINYY